MEDGGMSAEVVDCSLGVLSSSTRVRDRIAEAVEDNSNTISSIQFEILYQLCCAPEPTPEQIAKEEFLLECD
jgi:hypothetical protein